MISKWISGKELIDQWGIQDFEIFDSLRRGLQPYYRYANDPILCPQDCHEGSYLIKKEPKILKALNELKKSDVKILFVTNLPIFCVGGYGNYPFSLSTDNIITLENKSFYKQKKAFFELRTQDIDDEIKTILRETIEMKLSEFQSKIITVKNEDPRCTSWKFFTPPSDKERMKEIVKEVMKAVFKVEDVEKFEEKTKRPHKSREHKEIMLRYFRENLLDKKYTTNQEPAKILRRLALQEHFGKEIKERDYQIETYLNWLDGQNPHARKGRPKKNFKP